MGYYSQFKLALQAEPEQLEKFKDFLAKLGEGGNQEASPVHWGEADAAAVLMGFEREEESCKGLLVYGDSGSKLYDPWNGVINLVFDYCDKEGIGAAYAEVGEEAGDLRVLEAGPVELQPGIDVIQTIGSVYC